MTEDPNALAGSSTATATCASSSVMPPLSKLSDGGLDAIVERCDFDLLVIGKRRRRLSA
jgi:hypothetical protein